MKWIVPEREAAIIVHPSEPLRHDRAEETNEIKNTLGVWVGEDDVAEVVSSGDIKEVEEKVSPVRMRQDLLVPPPLPLLWSLEDREGAYR